MNFVRRPAIMSANKSSHVVIRPPFPFHGVGLNLFSSVCLPRQPRPMTQTLPKPFSSHSPRLKMIRCLYFSSDISWIHYIQGLLASSPGSPCVELRQFMNDRGLIPDDADDIAFRCPKMKSYLDCEINYVQEQKSYHRLEELFGIRSLTNDLCDEDSKLHKDYVNNIDCFKSVLESEWSTCKDLGRDVYSEFSKFITALEDPDTPEMDEEERRDQSHCLVQSYALACLGIQVMETCGADAYYAFLEIGLKSGGLKGNCVEYHSNLLNLDFADFLSTEMEHAHMDRIRALFGYMKK